ncbi:alpha/beta hydrolase [Pacificibacter marinus]|uniref:alpha/beta hydrolase n=1 Tax=Pacificibacter marinus TaxID=658057 RepID=UPI00147CD612|nr:enterochelin esterase domain-containing protein [Pacificibacter marinus]
MTQPLSVAEGAYVRGRLDSLGHTFDLVMGDAQTPELRQLLTNNTGSGQFHFVAPSDTITFVVRNNSDVAFTPELEIERIVTPSEMTGETLSYTSPEIAKLAKELAQGGTTDAFWEARAKAGTPMIEPTKAEGQVLVTYLWRGATKNVRLWGGPASDHTWMTQLADSDVWYVTFEMPDTARMSYGMAPDVPQFEGGERENRVALLATLQADPLNKTPIYSDATDKWAQRSMLEGENAPIQPGMTRAENSADEVPKGTITPKILISETQPKRHVDYYRPAGFDPSRPDTVLLVMFDGPAYQTERAPVPAILDRLIATKQLPQVVVALIDPVDSDQRGVDLTCNPAFMDTLAHDWLPQIEAEFGKTFAPSQRVVSGSSYGGLASACMVHRHSDLFVNAVVLSGSFWWGPEGYDGQGMPYMSALWADYTPPNVRIWMSAGLYEAGRAPGLVSIFETTRHLRDVMQLKGVADVTYREYAGGHDYLVWRGALAEGLLHLFGTN